jgi:hypothetical protein
MIVACNSGSTIDPSLLHSHLLDEENGLSRTRIANNIKTTVTLRPPLMDVMLATQRDSSLSQNEIDSLLSSLSDQLTFIVNLRHDEPSQNDIMYNGVSNINEYKEQAYALNFGWDEMALLRCGSGQYKPILSTLENTYGLTYDRNVILVFKPSNKGDKNFYESEYIHLEITNNTLRTGTQHFKFRRADLVRVSDDI